MQCEQLGRKIWLGHDEWHGSIFLEHGKAYDVVEMIRKKQKPFVVSVRDDGQATVMNYHTENEFKKFWQ